MFINIKKEMNIIDGWNTNYRNRYTFIDLFSGAGGLSCGMVMAGYTPIASVEIMKEAVETYKYNFIDNKNFNENVETRDIRQKAIKEEKESDIIVTNPPFSLFRDYITQLIKYNKKFIIVGNKNSVISKQIFSFFVNNEVNYGINNISNFIKKDGNIQKFGNVGWFTNIILTSNNKKLELTKKYNDNDYYKYCNYNAINVDKIKDIPIDYDGIMGVPITFLEKYNSNQFKILGIDRLGYSEKLGIKPIGEKWCKDYFKQGNKGHFSPKMKLLVLYENGLAKVKYLRVLIKRIDI